jgi:hypothetical protein
MERKGDWMQTYTGRVFWPLDPDAMEVHLEDIAQALGKQCRYAGHCLRFYSVAEHCVLLSRAVSAPAAIHALLHDAAEAYLVDLPRPVKRHMPNYLPIEEVIMERVWARFGCAADSRLQDEVMRADDAILRDEMEQNMAPPPRPWGIPEKGLGVRLEFWTPDRAPAEFLARAAELGL